MYRRFSPVRTRQHLWQRLNFLHHIGLHGLGKRNGVEPVGSSQQGPTCHVSSMSHPTAFPVQLPSFTFQQAFLAAGFIKDSIIHRAHGEQPSSQPLQREARISLRDSIFMEVICQVRILQDAAGRQGETQASIRSKMSKGILHQDSFKSPHCDVSSPAQPSRQRHRRL